MIRTSAIVLAILALLAAPTAGFACEKGAAAAATVAKNTGEDCGCDHPAGDCAEASHAKLAELIAGAEAGCEKSMQALLAKAKDCGCPEAAALAAKAEDGTEQSKAALIAMMKEWSAESKTGDADETSMAMLASRASHGCAKSTQALIERAKHSGCAKSAELAEKAEHGCEKSKAALIAMYQEESTDKEKK